MCHQHLTDGLIKFCCSLLLHTSEDHAATSTDEPLCAECLGAAGAFSPRGAQPRRARRAQRNAAPEVSESEREDRRKLSRKKNGKAVRSFFSSRLACWCVCPTSPCSAYQPQRKRFSNFLNHVRFTTLTLYKYITFPLDFLSAPFCRSISLQRHFMMVP